jgi:hypothetical protein
MKFFQKVNMASETVDSFNRTGLFKTYSGSVGTNASVDSGAFVITTKGLAPNDVYNNFLSGSTIVDFNTFIATGPAAATDKGVYVVDIVKVTDGTIGGNVYREGAKTLSMTANAGEKVAMRLLNFNDQFLLGADNISGSPTAGQYAVLTAGSAVTLTGSAGIPGTGLVVRLDQKQTISEGIDPNGVGYLCTVIQL